MREILKTILAVTVAAVVAWAVVKYFDIRDILWLLIFFYILKNLLGDQAANVKYVLQIDRRVTHLENQVSELEHPEFYKRDLFL
jgi:hypothetical protein